MFNEKFIRIIKSNTFDTCINLAYEEYFMNKINENEMIIFWWQSENAVVIGRNQNPYQECNIEKIKENNVDLVRRLSGGGAVYHDRGNLNFSFISKEKIFDVETNFKILIKALSYLGIDSQFTGRNDLTVNGRKFSGNAFIHDEDRHLHHGTLLINSDVSKIANYLNVSHEKLDTKGFDSVKSRVINLNDLVSDISIDKIIDSVEIATKKVFNYSVERICLSQIKTNEINVYLDKYYNDLWNYGDTPSFSVKMNKRFNWGSIEILMNIEKGFIKSTHISTDALEAEEFNDLSREFNKILLEPEKIYKILKESNLSKIIINDIYNLISENIFN